MTRWSTKARFLSMMMTGPHVFCSSLLVSDSKIRDTTSIATLDEICRFQALVFVVSFSAAVAAAVLVAEIRRIVVAVFEVVVGEQQQYK